jgi:hypothetical protein
MFFKTSNGEIDWTGKNGWYNPENSSEGFRSNTKYDMSRLFIQASILVLVILLIYYLYRMCRKS